MLENADALFEKGKDARGRLVELLGSLCSMGEGKLLKMLVTSGQRLLPETHEWFRDGLEVEVNVGPLTPVDASNFFMEVIRDAVQNHPNFKNAIMEGHPGTLVRMRRNFGGERSPVKFCQPSSVCSLNEPVYGSSNMIRQQLVHTMKSS